MILPWKNALQYWSELSSFFRDFDIEEPSMRSGICHWDYLEFRWIPTTGASKKNLGFVLNLKCLVISCPRDGDSANATLMDRYCGDSSQAPDIIISTYFLWIFSLLLAFCFLSRSDLVYFSYNFLWFAFVTDGSVQNRGFELTYTTSEVYLKLWDYWIYKLPTIFNGCLNL